MIQEFIELCEQVVQQPDAPLGKLYERVQRASGAEVHRLAGPILHYDHTLSLHRLFELQAERTPDQTALIVSSGKELTYLELNERANALAWKLINRGVRRDEPVGILTGRDETLIIMLIAVLKAGAAYLPIDPAFPP